MQRCVAARDEASSYYVQKTGIAAPIELVQMVWGLLRGASQCDMPFLAGLALAEGEEGADEEEDGQDGPEDELEELGG
jgi:hypothetical protein